MQKPSMFRTEDGLRPFVLVTLYMALAWGGGIALLAFAPLWAKAIGVLLTAHGMVVSAYMLHEFAHHSIFRSPAANTRWGVLMTWITGSCYARFEDIRHKHVRHHADRADVITFDFKGFLLRQPAWVRKLVLALEWAYIPVVEFIMHAYVMVLPFISAEKRHQRGRTLMVLGLRGAAFAALGWASPVGLAGYALAYLLMIHVLRFADAYQHTYDAFAVLQGDQKIPDDKLRDRAYEQRNTYSNVVSLDHPLLNLLLLNFSFHNAHHQRPVEPWYRLPQLHAKLYGAGDAYKQVLPMSALLAMHHRYRVRRILADDYGDVVDTADGRLDPRGFYGAVGVSFLTAI